eukprot:747673_1
MADSTDCVVCRGDCGEFQVFKCQRCKIVAHRGCLGHKNLRKSESTKLWTCHWCCADETERERALIQRTADRKRVANDTEIEQLWAEDLTFPECSICKQSRRGLYAPTDEGDWAHVVCALWVAETAVDDFDVMAPVTDIPLVPSSRFQLKCSLCPRRVGSCIQCSFGVCCVPFHPLCGLEDPDGKVKMLVIPDDEEEFVHRLVFCQKHGHKASVTAMRLVARNKRDRKINNAQNTENDASLKNVKKSKTKVRGNKRRRSSAGRKVGKIAEKVGEIKKKKNKRRPARRYVAVKKLRGKTVLLMF